MDQDPTIIFICEHGAAKSIIAAAHFNKLARENNLSLTGVARGTHPDPELSSKTVAGLREDGLAPTEWIPIKLTRDEIDSAQRVVSFCELPEEYRQKGNVEYWKDVPPVSENYESARDAIFKHLQELLNNL